MRSLLPAHAKEILIAEREPNQERGELVDGLRLDKLIDLHGSNVALLSLSREAYYQAGCSTRLHCMHLCFDSARALDAVKMEGFRLRNRAFVRAEAGKSRLPSTYCSGSERSPALGIKNRT